MDKYSGKKESKQESKESKESKQDESEVNDINKLIYKTILKDEYIYLKPVDLNFKTDNVILSKLKKKVEGKCIKEGFIVPDSVIIQTRSLGMINNASFDGMTTYKVTFSCNVCNPLIGQIVQCKVGNIDKTQVICYIGDPQLSPVEIYLFKQHHIGNEDYMSLKNGDIINAKIAGSKWEFESVQIISIAQLVNIV